MDIKTDGQKDVQVVQITSMFDKTLSPLVPSGAAAQKKAEALGETEDKRQNNRGKRYGKRKARRRE